ncbi:MAG: DUF1499 domain-containing protein [Proteobacteria bacterium]|nr:DUF1499 domain-containing protein [Pseudomonadota bacterium]MBU1639184.1 DUF1499 domain-containing protein [Pseudomonadota bacterium]
MKRILATLCLAIITAGCSGTRPELGIVDGKLRPCPPSPNCVSSTAGDDKHVSQAFYYAGPSVGAWQALTSIIRNMERAEIISQTGTYLHVEFTSAIFGFVDDAEFLLDPKASRIEVRSASRLGHSDFGVNRNRLQKIKKLFAEQCAVAVREN